MKKETVVTVFVSVLLLSSILGARLVIPVNASVIHHVYPGESIQDAVNSAQSGDTVFVHEGTYSENVFVNKSLTLIGEDANTTIIEGGAGTDPVIGCYNASNVKISGFTIWQGSHGIDIINCDNITVSDSMVTTNSIDGIFVKKSRNITINDNIILNNGYTGVYLRSSKSSIVSNNTISKIGSYGIYLYYSKNSVVSDNTVSDADDRGIWVWGGTENIFSGNTISKSSHGIGIRDSTDNTLRDNNMTDNRYNFYIEGMSRNHYTHDIDSSNTVDGKPIYYWVNQHDKQVPSDAGYVALVDSTNIIVRDLNLAKNRQGVLIAYTTNSTIMNVNASYNYIGIHIPESDDNSIKSNFLTSNQVGIESIESNDNTLTRNTIKNNDRGIHLYRYSSYNNISGNTIKNNDWGIKLESASNNNTIYGNTITNNSNHSIYLYWSSNNSIYHNNLINNTKQAQVFTSSNVWDDGYPSGGNYWSNYNGTDLNGDGIGDTPYLIPDDNQDNYPLMAPVIVADQIVIDERSDVGSLQTIAFHAIWAHNSSNVVEGSVYVNSTQYLTDNTGWISFNATRDTVGKLVWTITSFGSFYAIWDRIQIVEGGSSRAETNITETETVWFKTIYEYDGSVFDGTKGTLYVNGSAMTWSTSKERWEYNFTFDTPGTRIFKTSGVSDDQYGLTTINDLAGAQSITWREREEEEDEVPFWAQWWLWTIIGIVLVIVVTAIYFLRKRKSSTPTPHSPPPPPVRGIVVPIDTPKINIRKISSN